jgi:glycine/D-amino acid oxidase-like deaminating enzyme
MHYTFPPEVDLAVRSDAMFGAWPDLTGRPAVVRRTGFVRLVAKEETDLLRANVSMQRQHGARAEVVDGAELAKLAPGLRTDDVECAAWEPHGGYGDGAIVAGDLAGCRQGTRVRSTGRIPGFGRWSPTVSGSLGCGPMIWRRVRGHRRPRRWGLVNAAAGHCRCRSAIETELRSRRGHRSRRAPERAWPASTRQPRHTSVRRRPGSEPHWHFTGPRGADPDRIATTAPDSDLAELVGSAAHRVPAFAESGIAAGITGVYDMTPDARPMLGEVPGRPGLVLAAGFSGMGFKISPAVGEALAELIVAGAATHVDLEAFRPGRFADGQPIHPALSYADD